LNMLARERGRDRVESLRTRRVSREYEEESRKSTR
jgi:hypothetical protein